MYTKQVSLLASMIFIFYFCKEKEVLSVSSSPVKVTQLKNLTL